MTIPQKIINALSFTGFPVSQTRHDGTEDTYFVFRLDSFPDNFGNDDPLHDVTEVQLSLFAPFATNTHKLRKQVKRALANAGFTYPTSTDASGAVKKSDGTEQHIVFECVIVEDIEDA